MEVSEDKKMVNSVHATIDEESFPELQSSDSSSSGKGSNDWSGWEISSEKSEKQTQ